MASVSTAIQYTIEEGLVPSIHEAGWDLDPIFPMVGRTSARVVKNRYGRSWQVLRTWVAGVAGGAKFNAVDTNTLTAGDNTNVYTGTGSYPSWDETSAPAFFQSTTDLVEHRGNFFLPHEMLRADQLTHSIGSVVGQNIKAVGTLLAQQEASVFYSTVTAAATKGALAQIDSTAGDAAACTSNGNSTAEVVLDLSTAAYITGRIHRFRPGMMVDIYDSTGATKRNSNFYIVIDNVDPLAETVVLRRVDGGTFQVETQLGGGVSLDGSTYGSNGCDEDLIVIKDSIGVAPNSLESWIADGSTVSTFFNIDVTKHGQFKSYRVTVSAALSEIKLNQNFGWIYEAFPGKTFGEAITTQGVILGMINNANDCGAGTAVDGTMRYDRQGRALDMVAGFEGFRYRFAGKPLTIWTSTYCNKGTMYIGKFRNGGIMRYVPPTLPGARVDSRFGSEVEFIKTMGSTGGYQGIFMHARNSTGGVTDFMEAPFKRQYQLMPEQINWLRLGSITEGYS